jgi:hypothetical protein
MKMRKRRSIPETLQKKMHQANGNAENVRMIKYRLDRPQMRDLCHERICNQSSEENIETSGVTCEASAGMGN